MENKELLDRIQEKIVKIANNADEFLEKLNKETDEYAHAKSMYDCDKDYYTNIARYAWAERAKKSAMLDMQSFLNELRKELEQ